MPVKDSRLIEALHAIKDEEGSQRVIGLFGDLQYEDFTDNFLFVYGTLRKGQYNYHRIRNIFGKENFVYIGKTEAQRHKLYDLGDYPAMMVSTRDSVPVVGDIMYCSDKVFNAIKEMEYSSGYIKDDIRVWIQKKTGTIISCMLSYFIAGKQMTDLIFENREKFPVIKCGDWNEYLMATEEEKKD